MQNSKEPPLSADGKKLFLDHCCGCIAL